MQTLPAKGAVTGAYAAIRRHRGKRIKAVYGVDLQSSLAVNIVLWLGGKRHTGRKVKAVGFLHRHSFPHPAGDRRRGGKF